MSQISNRATGISIGAVMTLTGNSGGPISPDGAGNINIVTNTTPGSVTGGTNPSTVVGAGTSLTITQNNQAIFTLQTTDNTPTDFIRFPLSVNEAIAVFIQLIASNSDFTSTYGGTQGVTSRRNVLNTQMTLIQDNSDGIATLVTSVFVIDGNDLVFRVTGETGETYSWRALVSWVIQQ